MKEYINEAFPYNGKRLVMIFLAFGLHPGFREVSALLDTVIEALQLVNEIHSQRCNNMNPPSNLAKYIAHGAAQFLKGNEELPMGGTFIYNTFMHTKEKRFQLAQKLVCCILIMSAGEMEFSTDRNRDTEKMHLVYFYILLCLLFLLF